jgi:prevent-host-death family protein
MTMQKVPSNDAQNEFQFVMDQVCSGLGPVLITGMRGNAVLVSEMDWRLLKKRLKTLEVFAVDDGAAKIPETRAGRPSAGTIIRD